MNQINAKVEIHIIKGENGIHIEYQVFVNSQLLSRFDNGLAAQDFAKKLAKCLQCEYAVIQ